MVFKKVKKLRGVPFKKNDERHSEGSPYNDCKGYVRLRERKTIFDRVSDQLGTIPPGANLRPFVDSNPQQCESNASQNWLINNTKWLEAQNDALKCHNSKKTRTNHTPKWKPHRVRKLGLGVQMRFKCGFRNCKFESECYDLYEKTNTGQPLQNVQLGIAMSKTDLTPKTVETLATTLNLDPPNLKHLHKSYSKALACSETLAEQAMADNREEVTSTLRLKDELREGEVPMADVALDGQYSNRSYHFPTGKSDSVSVPVIEQVTGQGLLIQHVNLSHRDGTLPSSTHINSGETLGAKLNYEKTYQAPNYPLHFGVVTTDGDTGLIKSLESGKELQLR